MKGLQLGSFRLVRRLGRGGMGEVWLAEDDSTRVAVKVMLAERARDPFFLGAFETEVRATASLVHPNIALVLDYGVVPLEAQGELIPGSPWLAMELVTGGTLSEAPPGSWAELAEVLHDLLNALAHAHARGVLHRDLKPANVLLGGPEDWRPGVKLADFGLAHAAWRDPASRHHAAGTPAYMPPEQRYGRWGEQGPWTDLYALGRTVEVLLAGAVYDVPTGLREWIARLTARDLRARFHRAADAAWALRQVEAGTLAPPPPGVPTELLSTAAASTKSTLALLWEPDLGEPGPARDAPVAAPNPPPIPADWRQRSPPALPAPLWSGAARLVGLRVPALVGREAIRDALWAALREVAESRRPRAVVLTGPPGVGKRALARWLAERAHELGAADVSSGGAPVDPARSVRTLVVRMDGPRDAAAARRVQTLLDRDGASVLGVVALDTPSDSGLLAHPSCTTLAVGLMAETDLARLVRDRIPARSEDVLRLARRAEGSPAVAVALVEAVAARQAFARTPHGLGLTEPVPLPPAGDGLGRLDALLREVGLQETRALELAAVLGPCVDHAAWVRCCRAAEASPVPIERLAAAGVAAALDEDRWGFAHPALRRALLERASARDRLRIHHEIALGAAADPEGRATHLRGLGRHDEAATAMLEAAEVGIGAGRYDAAHLSLEQAAESLAPGDPRQVRLALCQAEIDAYRARPREALDALDRLRAEGTLVEGSASDIDARLARARAHYYLSEFGDAESAIEAALRLATRAGDRERQGTCLMRMGALRQRQGRFGEAVDLLERALSLGAHPEREVHTRIHLGHARAQLGDFAAARALYTAALALAEAEDQLPEQIECVSGLGDLARLEGDLAAAEEAYRTVLAIHDGMGSPYAFVPCANLALTWIRAGEFAKARLAIRRALDRVVGDSALDGVAAVHIVALAACAGHGDWAAFDHHLRRGLPLLRRTGVVDIDVAGASFTAGELAIAAGRWRRAVAALEVAAEQFAGLEMASRVEDAEALLARAREVVGSPEVP